MTAYLVGGGLGAIAVVLLAFWLIGTGRKLERGKSAENAAEIKDAQLEAATQPRDPTAVIDRLRKGGF